MPFKIDFSNQLINYDLWENSDKFMSGTEIANEITVNYPTVTGNN